MLFDFYSTADTVAIVTLKEVMNLYNKDNEPMMQRGASKGNSRSAITGRYVTPATAARHPRTTVTEKPTKRTGK